MINLQKEINKIYIVIDHPVDEISSTYPQELAGRLVCKLGEQECREFYKKDKTLFNHDKYLFNAERAIYDYTLYMLQSHINEKKLNKTLDF